MRKLSTFLLGIIMFCGLVSTSYAQNDTIPPVVLEFTSEFQEGGVNDSVTGVFTLTYSEDIQLSNSFTIVSHAYINKAWEEHESYSAAEVVAEGNVITVTAERPFWPLDRYEFVVAHGSVQDTAGNTADSFTRTFMADEDVPEVVDFNIDFTQNELNDSASAVFTLTYSENVQLVDTFQIVTHIYKDNTWEEYDRYDESQVTVDGNIITITSDKLFKTTDRFELIVTFASVVDMSGNLGTSFTRTFIADTSAPEVLTLETEFIDSEFADSVGAVFTLTYSEDVKLAPSYKFSTLIRNNGGWEEYEVIADTGIEVSGQTLTLQPARLFATAQSYELVVVAGSVRDLADNPATSYTKIFLADTIRPNVIDISPDLSVPVPTNAIFTFVFDENVQLVDNFGFYTYHWDEAAGEYVEYERLDASHAKVENNVVTFNPSLDFRPGERAQIVLTAGSVLDVNGNRFYYIRENDTINYVSERFVTGEGGVSLVTFLPAHLDTLTAIPEELSISFGEAITFTDTTAVDTQSLDSLVYLQSDGTDLEYEASYNATSNAIIIVPAQELAAGSSYTYGFTDGFLNEANDSIPPAEATFTILDSSSEYELYTIAEINGEGDVSPEPDQVVQIMGTITGIYDNEGFFVQDSVGTHSGIWVEFATTADYAIGDGVVVTGVVDTLQSVIAFVAEEVVIDNDPIAITPLAYDFDTDSLPMYTNVLVQIINGRATEADEAGEWVLFAEGDTDSVIVNSQMYTFTPVDSSYYSVTGIVTGWDSIYRVEPRMETDITEGAGDILAIAEVYGEDVTSPYLDEVVQIAGTVTAVYDGEGFYVQDENAEKGGIWVEYTGDVELVIGDGVSVTGTVTELEGLTYIVADEFTMISAPLVVEPIVVDFATDSIAMYQGVLVQVADARATAADENGEWMVYANNDMDSVIVSSRLYAFTPVADDIYDVTGVITFRDSIYRVEPRMEADVTFATSVGLTPDVDFSVYPNPFGNYIKIRNNDKLSRIIISNITGQRVADVAYPAGEINTSHLINGVYIINMFRENKLVKTSRIIKR